MWSRNTSRIEAGQIGYDNLMSPTRKTSIILPILLVMAFVAFLAWANLHGQANSSQTSITPAVQPPITPTAVPKTGFVVNIPQKALIKNYVTVSVEALPGTICKLNYISPSGETHQTDTIADAGGLCIWKWKIEETERKGNGRLIFTIGEISETHFMEILSNF
jgi:hypothetical protein